MVERLKDQLRLLSIATHLFPCFVSHSYLLWRLTVAIDDAGVAILPLIQIAIKKTHNNPGIRPVYCKRELYVLVPEQGTDIIELIPVWFGTQL